MSKKDQSPIETTDKERVSKQSKESLNLFANEEDVGVETEPDIPQQTQEHNIVETEAAPVPQEMDETPQQPEKGEVKKPVDQAQSDAINRQIQTTMMQQPQKTTKKGETSFETKESGQISKKEKSKSEGRTEQAGGW